MHCATRNEPIDFCVVGEPTSVDALGDTIKNGRRGSLSGSLIVRGIQGHVAYPHLARNPVHQLAPALAELAAERWDDGDAFFPPTTFQVSNIRAGTGASQRHSRHLRGRLQPALRTGLDRGEPDAADRSAPAAARPRVRPDLDRRRTAVQHRAGRAVEPLARAIRAVTGRATQLSTTGGTSDGRFLATICRQVIEFGPTNASIHKIDEHIAVADLEPLKDIYRGTLERLLT